MKKTDYREKTKEENEFNKKFGGELNVLIKKDKKIHKQDLYKNIGLSNPGTLSQYLNGNKGLSVYRFSRIATTINLSDIEILSLFKTETAISTQKPNQKPNEPLLFKICSIDSPPFTLHDKSVELTCRVIDDAYRLKNNYEIIRERYEDVLYMVNKLKKEIKKINDSKKKAKRGKKGSAA